LFVSVSSILMEAEIDSKAFQEIVDDFVEVHKVASHEVDLGLVLSDVKISLQAGEKKYKEFLSSFSVSCENAKTKLNSHITKLHNAQDEAKNQIANTWGKQLTKGRSGIKEAQAGVVSVTAILEKNAKEMEKLVIDYHNGVAESDSKLIIVKQLRDIIEDELINPAGKSFIQIGTFNEKLKDLETLIKKSNDPLYTPILETLVQLASEQNFSDQKILKAILKNLNALAANIRKFKKDLKASLKSTLITLKKQEENLIQQLQDYHHLEQRYTSDVVEANENTGILNEALLSLASEVAKKEGELRNIGHLCDTENKMFKDGLQRLSTMKKDVTDAVNTIMDLNK